MSEEKGYKVTELFGFFAIDKDGDEGIMAAQMGDMMMPLVGADRTRIKQFGALALSIASDHNMKVKLKRFSYIEDLDIKEFLNEKPKSIICPKCKIESHNQGDVDHKFCVKCGWHDEL